MQRGAESGRGVGKGRGLQWSWTWKEWKRKRRREVWEGRMWRSGEESSLQAIAWVEVNWGPTKTCTLYNDLSQVDRGQSFQKRKWERVNFCIIYPLLKLFVQQNVFFQTNDIYKMQISTSNVENISSTKPFIHVVIHINWQSLVQIIGVVLRPILNISRAV